SATDRLTDHTEYEKTAQVSDKKRPERVGHGHLKPENPERVVEPQERQKQIGKDARKRNCSRNPKPATKGFHHRCEVDLKGDNRRSKRCYNDCYAALETHRPLLLTPTQQSPSALRLGCISIIF